MTTEGETTRKQAFKDLSEDALGFGGVEVRTARDLLIRPRLVLQAWMIEGPTGGGVYAKPLKLYLALNAILMLVVFLRGGMGGALEQMPADLMASLVAQSGKSRDAFMSDADGWMSFLTVPLMAPLYALVVLPFVRWWDAEDLGWALRLSRRLRLSERLDRADAAVVLVHIRHGAGGDDGQRGPVHSRRRGLRADGPGALVSRDRGRDRQGTGAATGRQRDDDGRKPDVGGDRRSGRLAVLKTGGG